MVGTRNSGTFTPGLYSKIKIIPTFLPLKRQFSKIRNIPGLKHFKNELEILILKNLKAKGACLRTGIFVISKEIENFLKKKYSISKKWQNSQVILKDLGVIIRINRNEFPNSGVYVSDFHCRLGNNRKHKFIVKDELSQKLEEMSLNENPKISFKFNRVTDESPDDEFANLVDKYNAKNFE